MSYYVPLWAIFCCIFAARPDFRKIRIDDYVENWYISGRYFYALVAQLDRALVYGTEGYKFESCQAQFLKHPLIA